MENVRTTRSGYFIDLCKVRVKLETGEEISGNINIAENGCSRLSEVFTKDSSDYITLFKCDNGHKVMFINKRHIIWATPVE
jgi:hypothetical protein